MNESPAYTFTVKGECLEIFREEAVFWGVCNRPVTREDLKEIRKMARIKKLRRYSPTTFTYQLKRRAAADKVARLIAQLLLVKDD